MPDMTQWYGRQDGPDHFLEPPPPRSPSAGDWWVVGLKGNKRATLATAATRNEAVDMARYYLASPVDYGFIGVLSDGEYEDLEDIEACRESEEEMARTGEKPRSAEEVLRELGLDLGAGRALIKHPDPESYRVRYRYQDGEREYSNPTAIASIAIELGREHARNAIAYGTVDVIDSAGKVVWEPDDEAPL